MKANELTPLLCAVFFILGMSFGLILGMRAGRQDEKRDWQKLMVEKGYAEMIPDQNHKVFNWKN